MEATFHALLLGLDGIRFVGHTHPTAVNSLLCARNAPEFLGNLFPDQIVCCGIAPLYIPYTDPGVALARAIKRGVQEFHEKHGELPKVILMQNHGMVALGRTPAEVESACAMQVKTARVLLGTMAFGGPNYFSDAQSARIHTRPDEDARRKLIFGA